MGQNEAARIARVAALKRSRYRMIAGSAIGIMVGIVIGMAVHRSLLSPRWYSTFDTPKLYWPVAVVTHHGWQRAYIDEAGMYRSFEDGHVINGVTQWRYVLEP